LARDHRGHRRADAGDRGECSALRVDHLDLAAVENLVARCHRCRAHTRDSLPRDRAWLVYLAAPSGHGSCKGGMHILHVHRAGEAKLRYGPLRGTLALAQATINAVLPLTRLDEPVVHPSTFSIVQPKAGW